MMKNFLSLILTLLTFTIGAQNVNIPDANFKACLLANTLINTNGDTEIQTSEATAFTGKIECVDMGIDDLTGIEAFTNLTALDCSQNGLNSLDLSQNMALTWVDCSLNTSIGTVDFSQNINLEYIRCIYNSRQSADFSANPNLDTLICLGNYYLDNIDLSQNTSLRHLNIESSSVTALDVSQNSNLEFLKCSSNDLTSLDVSQNLNLKELDFLFTDIANIDVSQNLALEVLICQGTLLQSIDVSQNLALEGLDCRNTLLTSIDISQNPNLLWLSAGDNQLTSLDLSQNPVLESLNCSNNLLTGLDISQNLGLLELACENQAITSLDLSQHSSLGRLFCRNAQLTSLDVSNGNNYNLVFFASGNPDLSCIKVDDPAYSTANWTNVDPTASFNTTCSTTVIENLEESELSIAPNPTSDNIRINTGYIVNQWQLFSINGQQLTQGTANNISISHFPKGMYIIRIQTDQGMAQRKIIKE